MLISANCTQFDIVTDNFSGPGGAGGVCVCLCVRTLTFELSDLWPIQTIWHAGSSSLSISEVEVINQNLQTRDEKNVTFSAMEPCYELTHIITFTDVHHNERNVFLVVLELGATSSEGFLVLHPTWFDSLLRAMHSDSSVNWN